MVIRSALALRLHGLRPLGRDRRRADHLAPRADRRAAQLGLSLLLAARRVAHRARAGRAGLRGRGPRLRELAVARDPADPPRASGAVRRVRQHSRPTSACWITWPATSGSRPVRIGNLAAEQLQLDVYGEVIDAVTHFLQEGGTLDRETEGVLRAWGEYVCRHWDRAGRRDLGAAHRASPPYPLASAVLGRARPAAAPAREGPHPLGTGGKVPGESRPASGRRSATRAWNPSLESYVAELDGNRMDATLLLLSWYGFEPAGSDRMRATYRRIREQLGAGEGSCIDTSGIRPRRRASPTRPVRARSASAASGGWSTWHWAAARWMRRGSCSSGSAAMPTMWALRRGDRSVDRGRAGQLPPGLHPRRPDQRGALDQPPVGGRDAAACGRCRTRQAASEKKEVRV